MLTRVEVRKGVLNQSISLILAELVRAHSKRLGLFAMQAFASESDRLCFIVVSRLDLCAHVNLVVLWVVLLCAQWDLNPRPSA